MRLFRSTDAPPLAAALRQKQQQGLRVSLIIPALNEVATIGPLVETAARDIRSDAGLIDEVLVMDGGSQDGTEQVAREAGAVVYRSDAIAGEVAAPPGKGTSMWKSLFVASGDILVFVDADIRDFGTHFYNDLVSPLLWHAQLQWTKAAYRRPFVMSGDVLEDYGGRVTEIMVRPLLNAWYPELAAVRQPLSGEYAVRRSVLCRVPFSSGYGVEMLLLLHLYRQYGLAALGEVDLGVRYHRNRSPRELGIMSYAILQTFLRFLRSDGRLCAGQEAVPQRFVRPGTAGIETVAVCETELAPVWEHPQFNLRQDAE